MEQLELARKNMVTNQLMTNHVSNSSLLEAALSIPRHEFVNQEVSGIAYSDGRFGLAEGRYMLQPETMYRMVQALGLDKNSSVLEIAAGTGYTTAVLAHIAGNVVATESIIDLATRAAHILTRMKIVNCSVKHSELFDGAPEQAPFDAIFINGKVDGVPSSLLLQLKMGGRLVCIEQRERTLSKAVMYIKYDGSYDRIDLFDAYAELVR